MRIKLLREYNGFSAGRELNLGGGVAELLIRRGIASPVEEPIGAVTDSDPDSDGKAEGGEEGEKKAFTSPPKSKRRR